MRVNCPANGLDMAVHTILLHLWCLWMKTAKPNMHIALKMLSPAPVFGNPMMNTMNASTFGRQLGHSTTPNNLPSPVSGNAVNWQAGVWRKGAWSLSWITKDLQVLGLRLAREESPSELVLHVNAQIKVELVRRTTCVLSLEVGWREIRYMPKFSQSITKRHHQTVVVLHLVLESFALRVAKKLFTQLSLCPCSTLINY